MLLDFGHQQDITLLLFGCDPSIVSYGGLAKHGPVYEALHAQAP
jgi:hypothetical protein